ncbi:SDR family NAD(P)-dependent oxidoreductase [Trinickia terrae]|uniref:SDR family NAD(P)-dependent oxidoreductase n=1 Tax=Trinickia terrae TaxID=2571161 RepID=UPI00198057C2
MAVTACHPEQVADLAKPFGDQVLALRLDVTKPEQIVESVRLAQAQFGRIDVLVNNAGVGYFGAISRRGRGRAKARTRRLGERAGYGPVCASNRPYRLLLVCSGVCKGSAERSSAVRPDLRRRGAEYTHFLNLWSRQRGAP